MGVPAAIDLLACPRCAGGLVVAGGAVRCASGHSYDLARQGYLNLLGGPEPANADTAGMVAARERVHAAGLFGPVATLVADALAGRGRLLEAGAGTAYYLRRSLGDDPAAVGLALDVAKAAARAAARADQRVAAVVTDVWRTLPVRPRCLDGVLCVFAPRNLGEFARVLRPDGRLVVATPGPAHLAGLRDRHGLLRIPPGKDADVVAAAAEFFELVDTRVARHRADVDGTLARDLIAMGPNAFHRVPEEVAAGEVAIDVTVQVFRPLR